MILIRLFSSITKHNLPDNLKTAYYILKYRLWSFVQYWFFGLQQQKSTQIYLLNHKLELYMLYISRC